MNTKTNQRNQTKVPLTLLVLTFLLQIFYRNYQSLYNWATLRLPYEYHEMTNLFFEPLQKYIWPVGKSMMTG